MPSWAPSHSKDRGGRPLSGCSAAAQRWRPDRRHTVREQGAVWVRLVLDERSRGKDGPWVGWVARERRVQQLERLVILPQPQVREPRRREQLGGAGRVLEGLKVRLGGSAKVVPQSVDRTQLQEGRVVPLERLCAHQILCSALDEG